MPNIAICVVWVGGMWCMCWFHREAKAPSLSVTLSLFCVMNCGVQKSLCGPGEPGKLMERIYRKAKQGVVVEMMAAL